MQLILVMQILSKCYKSEKLVSCCIREFNNNNSCVCVWVNKNIKMIIVEKLYIVANKEDFKQRNAFAKHRSDTKNTNLKAATGRKTN